MDLLNLNVDPQTIALITFFCVGLVQLIDQLFARDFKGAAKIAGSTVAGALLALAVPDLSVLTGAAIGLSASGIVTSLTFVGKKAGTTVVPAEIVA